MFHPKDKQIEKDRIIQIACDSSEEGFLLFGLGESGQVYQQIGYSWKGIIEPPSLMRDKE